MKLNTSDFSVKKTETGYVVAGNIGVTPEDGDGFPAFKILDAKVRASLPVPVVGMVEADVAVVLKEGGA